MSARRLRASAGAHIYRAGCKGHIVLQHARTTFGQSAMLHAATVRPSYLLTRRRSPITSQLTITAMKATRKKGQSLPDRRWRQL